MQSWLLNDRFAPRRDEDTFLYALHELALRLSRSFDPQVIMEQALAWVLGLGVGAAIVQLAPDGHALELVAADGLSPLALDALHDALHAPREEMLAGQALDAGRALVVAAAGAHYRDLDERAAAGGVGAAMAIPLACAARRPAALLLYAAAPEDLDPPVARLLDLLARHLALALDNAHAVDQLRAREALLDQRLRQLRRAYDYVAGERRMLASALDCAGDAVLVTDAQGRVQIGNQAVEQVLGIHPDLLIGRVLRHAPVPERLILLFQQARQRSELYEGELVLADGRAFHVSIAPVQIFDQPTQAYVMLFRDVTSFKQLAELKSQFVATVSHDMKSPLNTIGSYAELLELAGSLNQEQSGYVERILASVRRLSALVSDLLDLARIEAHVGIAMVSCDLSALLHAEVDEHLLAADSKRISIDVRLAADLPRAWADEARLRQVVHNLLVNALTYTPRDGVVWLSAEVVGDMLMVRIEDSGIGITAADLQHIFDPFYRSGSARAVNSEGTGLGLTIVKRIVEEHGGAIGAESAINGGSCFWFTLPVAPAEYREVGA